MNATQTTTSQPLTTDELIKVLKLHEGAERYGYTDSLGYISVGIGRCIDRRRGKGLTPEEQLYLLKNDIDSCKYELEACNWYVMQDDVRKCALIELVFCLGFAGLLKFDTFLGFMGRKQFEAAAVDLLTTKWAHQVGLSRATNVAYRIKMGIYP